MEPPEFKDGRSFVEVINEKYSPENFPFRRGPGMGVVVVPAPQGSPMKGEAWFRSTQQMRGAVASDIHHHSADFLGPGLLTAKHYGLFMVGKLDP